MILVLCKHQNEVPYSCEVAIDSFTDKSDGLSVIEAGVVVARRSHKAILIGQGGAKIKELGIMAREKVEQVRQQQGVRVLWLVLL